jgi:fatty-acyl-CoA synthase/long-chain acyl-CoA synthetase
MRSPEVAVPQPDILTRLAQSQGGKTAVIDDRPQGGVRALTFAQLEAEANRLANALGSRGVGPGSQLVWWGRNSIGVVCAMHAARKLGATAVPMNYRLTGEEAAFVVDDCDAETVYVDAEFAEAAARIRPRTPKVRQVLVFDGPAPPGTEPLGPLLAAASPEAPGAPDEPAATIIYTSGTTGKPKGALRRGLGDPEQVRRMVERIGYRPDDVYLTTGPLYHSGPGGFLMLAHNLGNTAVIQRRFDPEDWLGLVERYRVTTTFSAPTPIRMVCNLPRERKARSDRGSMRRMIANAAPWSFALKQLYLADFPEDSLWEVYGSTELGVNTILAPEDQRRKPGSCGRPAPGVEIKLLDDDGQEIVEPGRPGELYVRSRTVFDTYHKNHDAYELERRGEFHTVGDVAYFDDEGYFYICDRKKDMIISGGMNIYPAEVEAALEHHPRIVDAAVFGVPDEEWGEAVHAVVVPRPGEPLAAEEVVRFARERLASYKIPRSVSFASEIPRTGSGKILKRVLREPFWRGREQQV